VIEWPFALETSARILKGRNRNPVGRSQLQFSERWAVELWIYHNWSLSLLGFNPLFFLSTRRKRTIRLLHIFFTFRLGTAARIKITVQDFFTDSSYNRIDFTNANSFPASDPLTNSPRPRPPSTTLPLRPPLHSRMPLGLMQRATGATKQTRLPRCLGWWRPPSVSQCPRLL